VPPFFFYLADPPAPSWAGIITAVASGITAIALLCAALPALIKVMRQTRKVEKAIHEVHTIVNQQRTDLMNYQAALVRALKQADVEIPIDQSAGPEEPTH
jgi:hypothetical protein